MFEHFEVVTKGKMMQNHEIQSLIYQCLMFYRFTILTTMPKDDGVFTEQDSDHSILLQHAASQRQFTVGLSQRDPGEEM